MDETTDQISPANRDETYDDYEENPAQIRAEIEDTRAEMTQTINEIQERLSPDHLMDQVKDTVREATIGKVERVMERVGETIGGVAEPAVEAMGRAGTAIKETGKSVGGSMWRNPIPVALIGLGIGMLMMRRGRGGNGYDYQPHMPRTRNAMGETTYSGTGALSHVKDTATETLGHVKDTAASGLNQVKDSANQFATTVSSRFGQVLRDNPLAVGAVAVAAGTAVGLVLPSTKFENEYIGETSERLVDKAQEVARDALDKVQNAAQQMTSEQGQGTPEQSQGARGQGQGAGGSGR